MSQQKESAQSKWYLTVNQLYYNLPLFPSYLSSLISLIFLGPLQFIYLLIAPFSLAIPFNTPQMFFLFHSLDCSSLGIQNQDSWQGWPKLIRSLSNGDIRRKVIDCYYKGKGKTQRSFKCFTKQVKIICNEYIFCLQRTRCWQSPSL